MTESKRRVVPFSDADSVMRVLDEPGRPQTIELEVAVAGTLDDDRLRAGVATAANAHPMARARQLRAGLFDTNDRWEIAEQVDSTMSTVTCASSQDVDDERDAFFSGHIDVCAGPPFRIRHLHGPDGSDRVLLSVSHVAFDGVGALRLLRSVSRAYAGEPDHVPDIDPVDARRIVAASARRRRTPMPTLGQRPTRVTGTPGRSAARFGILHVDLAATDVARVDGATVNDVLLAAVHLSIEQWAQKQGDRGDLITLMMPVNERPADWRGEVVANLVQSAQITSTRSDRIRPSALLRAIAAQTTRIKRDGVAANAMAATAWTPIAVRRLLPRLVDLGAARAADTAVLSNLGCVEAPPWFGASGIGLWFSPPPRQPVVLTIGTATAGDALGISLRWCTDAFSAADARAFAEQLVAALRQLREEER